MRNPVFLEPFQGGQRKNECTIAQACHPVTAHQSHQRRSGVLPGRKLNFDELHLRHTRCTKPRNDPKSMQSVWTNNASRFYVCQFLDQGCCDGYQSPVAISCERSSRRRSEFIWSNQTVARPEAVRPWMCAASSLKWSCQEFFRGLKRATMLVPSGSIAVRFVPLWALHRLHAQARFAISLPPACWRAITCSTWNGPANSSQSGRRQYSHRPVARARTCCRMRGDIKPASPTPGDGVL